MQTGPVKKTPLSWKDIIVVIRKPFLKLHRVELKPFVGVTMNDNMIRHESDGGELAYWLTDVLAIGVEGMGYIHSFQEPYDLVARQARRLPTVNQYNWSAALDFHYVPVYGKFAVLDRKLVTVGGRLHRRHRRRSERGRAARHRRYPGFTNFLIEPNIGVDMRFFLTKWLTVHLGIRDYIFLDQFEPTDRSPRRRPTADEAKVRRRQLAHQQHHVPDRPELLAADLVRVHDVPVILEERNHDQAQPNTSRSRCSSQRWSRSAARPARRSALNGLDDDAPVRHRRLLVKHRFEVTPLFESSIDADFQHTVGGGLKLEYHFSDMFSIGVLGVASTSIQTSARAEHRRDAADHAEPDELAGAERQKQFLDHLNSMPVHGAAYLSLTPWYGKLAAFGAAFVAFDFYFQAGVSFARADIELPDHSRLCDDTHPGTSITEGGG